MTRWTSPLLLVWLARLRPESSVALPPVRRLPFGFDDDEARGAAEVDPVGFVGDLPKRAILNKVQRVPALFAALKTAVDRHRLAGRFILTGSANVLLVPKLADSLAGRMEILRLHPLTQGELARRQPRFLDALFAGTRLTAARGALRRRNERSLRRRRTLGSVCAVNAGTTTGEAFLFAGYGRVQTAAGQDGRAPRLALN